MVTSRVKLGAKSVLFSALAAQAVLLSSCDGGGRFKPSILSLKASSDPVVERISPTQEISNDARPVFKISNLKPGAVVTLHTDENCAGPAIKEAVSESDSLIMTVNLDSERGYKFRARSVDKLSKVTCSSEASPYLLDQTPPESPKLFLEDPKSSPNLDPSPKFKVSYVTEADHITLYAALRGTEPRCTPDREVALKKVTETSNGSNPSIEIESQALAPGHYFFYVTSTDPAGNHSLCPSKADEGIAYTVALQPGIPSLTLINPAQSPSNISTPRFKVGNLSSGDNVKLFSQPDCTKELRSEDTSNSDTLELTSEALEAEGSFFYSVLVTNFTGASVCQKLGFPYVFDRTPPGPLALTLLTGTNGAGSDPRPRVRVTGVEDGNTVALYSSAGPIAAGCDSTNLRATAVARGTSIDLSPNSNLIDGTHTLYVRATDSAQNTTACPGATIQYTLRSIVTPREPTLRLVAPARSPSNQSSPVLEVGELQALDSIELFSKSQCQGAAILSGVAAGQTLTLRPGPLTAGSYQFSVRISNSTGGTLCGRASLDYLLDLTPPTKPSNLELIKPKTSPARDPEPIIQASISDTRDTLSVHTGTPCTAQNKIDSKLLALNTSSQTVQFQLKLSEGLYSFYVAAEDSAGNVACSTESITYQLDLTAPSAPSLVELKDPSKSPGSVSTPSFSVSGVSVADTVTLHSDDQCRTQARATGVVSAGTSIDLTLKDPLLPGSYQFYAKAMDSAGNTSECSRSYAKYTYGELPTLVYQKAPYVIQTGEALAIKPVTLTGVPVECSLLGILPLPEGLKLDTDSCVVSGTPTSSTLGASVSYPVIARNQFGSSEPASFILQVIANPPSEASIALYSPSSSPSNVSTPVFKVGDLKNGLLVSLHVTKDCSDQPLVEQIATESNLLLKSKTLNQNGTYVFRARAKDQQSGASTCSSSFVEYTLDTTAPRAPHDLKLIKPKASPSNQQEPIVQASVESVKDTFSIHSASDCSDRSLIVSRPPSLNEAQSTVQFQLQLQEGTYAFFVKATDAAGNSACSSDSVRYTLDTTAPSSPTQVVLVNPAHSPGNLSTPSFAVSGVNPGDLISLHTDASCSSLSIRASGTVSGISSTPIAAQEVSPTQVNAVAAKASDSVAVAEPASASGSSSIRLTVQNALMPGAYTFYAKATDPVGNTSTCSTAYAKYEYRIAPTLAYAQGTYFGRVGLEMALRPTALSGSSVVCSIDDTILPDGLSLNPQTCSVSGTPSKAHELQSYSVLAQDNWGQASGSFGLVISGCEGDLNGDNSVGAPDLGLLLSQFGPVTDQNRALDFDGSGEIDTAELGNLLASYGSCDRLPPTLEYESGTHFARAGAELTIKPKVLSGKSVACGVEEMTLPEGLTLDLQTCVVSGKTEKPITKTQYTVSAKNDYGTASATFDLVVGACIGDLDGDADVDAADNGLLLGQFGTISDRNSTLDFDKSGMIDTGDLAQLLTHYGKCGSSLVPVLEYARDPHFVTLGVETTIKPTLLTGDGVTCVLEGSTLPHGLSLDARTCVISGSATSAQPTTSYTIIARNAHGSSAPAVLQLVIDVCLGDLNGDGLITEEDRERFHLLWETGDMKADLNQDAGIDGLDVDRFEDLIAVGKCSVPSLQYPRVAFSYEVGGKVSIKPLTLGGGPVHCQLVESAGTSSRLPAGLLLDRATCGVSGKPTTPTARASYSVLATNLSGASAQAQFSLEIRAGSLVPVVDSQADSSTTGSGVSPTSSTVTPEKN